LNDIFLLNLDSFEWFLFRHKGNIIEHRRNHNIFFVGNLLYIMNGIDHNE